MNEIKKYETYLVDEVDSRSSIFTALPSIEMPKKSLLFFPPSSILFLKEENTSSLERIVRKINIRQVQYLHCRLCLRVFLLLFLYVIHIISLFSLKIPMRQEISLHQRYHGCKYLQIGFYISGLALPFCIPKIFKSLDKTVSS
jgi:hypothetical protein